MKIKTVLGDKPVSEYPVTLSHEHISTYSEYLSIMSKNYIDKNKLEEEAVKIFKNLKEKYSLGLFLDCTPVNLGRDIELLKRISEKSEVDIVCSTGFYYNDDPIIDISSENYIGEFMISDALNINAGIIKSAVESEELTPFNIKLLKATAIAQKKLNLPIVLHTNAINKNGFKAVELLTKSGVSPNCITVAHLSDTKDMNYIKEIAKTGCYIALDRLYDEKSEEYIAQKVFQISQLCDWGFEDKILLSHDDGIFQGFSNPPGMIRPPRFSYVFDFILPKIEEKLAKKLMSENPVKMLNLV